MSFILLLWSECFHKFANVSALSDFRRYNVDKYLKGVKIQFCKYLDQVDINVLAWGDFVQEEAVLSLKCKECLDGLRGAHRSLFFR